MPEEEPTPEELAEKDRQRKKRAKARQKYERKKERDRLIQEGLIVPGEPYHLTCKCCGKAFDSKMPHTEFCSYNCRQKYHRQERAEARKRECVCPVCGKTFVTLQYNAKYCSSECAYQGQLERQRKQKAAKWAAERARCNDALLDEKTA